MYNESVKEKFLHYVRTEFDESSLRHYQATLAMCENVERLLNKDVSEFSYAELVYLFEENGWISFATHSSVKSRILSYIKWRYNGEVPLDAPIYRLQHDDVKGKLKFTTEYARDLEDVKEYVREVLTYSDIHELWKDCIMITYCLLFYGFDIDEVGWIRLSDVNRISNEITLLNGKSYYRTRVDDDLIRLINKVAKAEDIEVVKGDQIVNVRLRNDEHILRSIDRNVPNYDRRGRVILRSFVDTKKKIASEFDDSQLINCRNLRRNITPKTVYRSGIFFRAFQSGECLDYRYFIKNERHIENYLQGKKLFDDYEMWKEIFH